MKLGRGGVKQTAGVLLALLLSFPASGTGEAIWLSQGNDGPLVHLYFFWSPTCPHCREARPVIETLAQSHPWLILHSADIVTNRQALQRYREMAAALGEEARSVPGFFVCGKMFVGWDNADGMGKVLLQTAETCREKNAVETLPAESDLSVGINAADYSLPLFTLIIAGLDAFNPCAFFVLLFLLSLLVNARSRKRMLLVGATFVFVSGALYFVFMAAWLNLFMLVGTVAWINVIAGVLAIAIGLFGVKDFVFAMRGPSLSIPDSAKPKLYQRVRDLVSAENMPMLLLGTITLALAANSYELLCTAGFPMVYTRVLTMNHLDTIEYYLYLLFYNLIYVIPLLLIVIAFVVTLGGRKLSVSEGRLLKLLSGTMMLLLGIVLLLKPELLSNLWTGAGLLLAALIVTLIARSRVQD
jgi:thiol-disulfide isomerase/thioredoxin